MDKLREEFEKWWQQEDYDNRLSNIQGVMFNRIKQGMFAAWQASRAGIAVEIPETVGYGMINRSEILANLHSIGLSIKGE